jgi:hypothetical protein
MKDDREKAGGDPNGQFAGKKSQPDNNKIPASTLDNVAPWDKIW